MCSLAPGTNNTTAGRSPSGASVIFAASGDCATAVLSQNVFSPVVGSIGRGNVSGGQAGSGGVTGGADVLVSGPYARAAARSMRCVCLTASPAHLPNIDVFIDVSIVY